MLLHSQDVTSLFPLLTGQDIRTVEKERRKKIATLEKEAVNILDGMAAVVYRKFVR